MLTGTPSACRPLGEDACGPITWTCHSKQYLATSQPTHTCRNKDKTSCKSADDWCVNKGCEYIHVLLVLSHHGVTRETVLHKAQNRWGDHRAKTTSTQCVPQSTGPQFILPVGCKTACTRNMRNPGATGVHCVRMAPTPSIPHRALEQRCICRMRNVSKTTAMAGLLHVAVLRVVVAVEHKPQAAQS